MDPKNTPEVIILCGGKGTRLSSVVSDRPKPLAEIGEAAFLDILLKKIFKQGFQKVILAVSHMKEKIIERYSGDKRILFSEEAEPLGTGGAVMNAMKLVDSDNFLVMNGDCYSEVDFKKMYEEHKNRGAMLSIALTPMEDISEYGSVSVNEANEIQAFREKTPEKRAGLVSAGVYVFNKKLAEHKPDKEVFSLEKELFPVVIPGKVYGHLIEGGVLDIGTPDRYLYAQKKLKID